MKKMKIDFIKYIAVLAAFGCSFGSMAQETADQTNEEVKTVVLPPLFDYPVAPEDLDWTQRSEWLAEHFWDTFDFKQSAVGQQQLNHAFATWILPLRYSNATVSMNAVDQLLKKLDKNPTLLLQFTRAADYCIHAPESAQMWIDDVYLKFLDAVLRNKKVSKTMKAKYQAQQKVLLNTRVGSPLPAFEFTSRTGSKQNFVPNGKLTLVEFGDPECSDCQMMRIALNNDDEIKNYIAQGLLDICFIIPDVESGDLSWLEQIYDYPDSWTVGAAEGLDDILDIRLSPSIYLIGSDGNLLLKNTGLNAVRDTMRYYLENAQKESAISSGTATSTSDN